MSKLTYEAAVNYLESFIDYEKKTSYTYSPRLWNLERMRLLLNSLGEPHQKLKVIHIAGSKGKGSTAAMIYSILNTAGYKTGLYTSPHLVTPLERFRVNSKLMSENQFCELVEQFQPHIDEVNKKMDIGKLSFFEIYTAMGFLFFAMENVDFLVLEVGLGGRLDATNVVEQPLVSVITQISLEHTNLLGDNLASIATEKAGIIKTNGLVISSPQQPEVMEVIEKSCAKQNAKLFQVGKDISFERLPKKRKFHDIDQSFTSFEDKPGQYFTLKSNIAEYSRCRLPLLGKHQLINAATAVGAIELLRFHGYAISEEQVKSGLEQTVWPARMQVIGREPTILLDVAHSPESARVLRESIYETFTYDKLILVVGISGDKDIKGIGAELCPIADIAILTKASNNPRAAAPARIEQEWKDFNITLVIRNTVASALDYARSIAGKNDLICITGSFYPIGEAITLLGVSIT
ncbi:bifunctional folylpolyglutamate synthase/dihydrofolate synthase [Candidatus Poribacteria bacterium]|nr:bifunctional folylpolyglutamate synthase/dihydrofolate synthase [Candidatus Poribacteria bacterium]